MLKLRKPVTDLYAWVEERKRRHLEEEEAWDGAVMELWDYDRPLDTVLSFKYLGRLLTETDDDCPAVIANLWKARKSCFFCIGSWVGRARIIRPRGVFTSLSSKIFYCSGRKCGWLPLKLIGFGGGSTIVWRGGYQEIFLGGGWRGRRITLLWGVR